MNGDLTRSGKAVLLDGHEIAQARTEEWAAHIIEALRIARSGGDVLKLALAGVIGAVFGVGCVEILGVFGG